MCKTLNFAHRGFSGNYPENTMISFIKACESGCDGIETDVQFTKDNIAILCHDETLDRTTTGIGYIKDYTLKELSYLDAGIKFDPKFKNEKIPTLEELLILAKERDIMLNLELKNTEIPYLGLEEHVISLLYKYNLQNKTILSSFNHYSMIKVKELDSSIKTGLLYEADLYKAEEYCLKVGADCLHPQYFSMLKKDIVKNIKKNNISINTYTVNKAEDMQRLIDLNIDIIITNFPDMLSKLLLNTKKM